MIASLVLALAAENLPITVNNTNLTGQILQLFPEIEEYYGETIKTDLDISINSNSGDFLTLNQYAGIEIGKNQKLKVILLVRCSNATLHEETAVQFDFDFSAVANVTVDPRWKLYLNIPTVAVTNVVISKDKVGMIRRRYDNLLTSVVRSQVNQVNAQFVKPFDITSLDNQTLPFLSNMFTNLHMTPFYQNEFFYLGFSYFIDTVPQTMQLYNHITNQINSKHSDKIVKVIDRVF